VVEAPPGDLRYEKGVVAMAKTEIEDPGTSGSQFFVVTADDAQLPPDYALVGRVSGGQDVIDRISVVETDPATDQPVEPVVIESVQVAEA
jgi:peptidyl-prolyl cis-trans isomerase B (cyclophilin B)